MTRYAAFLRGVNLGKRTVKSADLKAALEAMGFAGVRTLIASGNVLFDAGSGKGLRAKVEAALREKFGFEIGVVLRSQQGIAAMIASKPFAGVDTAADTALHVLMFGEPMAPPLPKLAGVAGDYDVARIDADAIYFAVYRKPDGTYLGRSALGEIDRLLPKGHVVTMRNWNTIEKAAAA